MTPALYSFAHWSVGLLPVDPAGRRCIEETFADWRSEAVSASGPAARAVVTARALWSVVRCVALTSSREACSREGIALLRRLTLLSAANMLLFVLFNWDRSIPVSGIQTALRPAAVGLLSVSWAVMLMPLLALLAGAWGRSGSTRVPLLGPPVVAGFLMLGAMGWAMPAANQAFREVVFALTDGQGTLRPGMNERSLIELVGLVFSSDYSSGLSALNLRGMFIVAVPVMLVVGTTARSLTGRRRLAATALPLLVFSVPFIVDIDSLEGFFLMWPAMFVAVFLTRSLVRGAARESGAAG